MRVFGFGRRSVSSRLLTTSAVFILFSFAAAAQSSRGTVTGLITDTSKAAVGSATVDLTNEDTKVSRSSTTNGDGVYRFDAVDPGNYTVRVTAPGFKTLSVSVFPLRLRRYRPLMGS